jgi:hypothetical protein
MNDHPDDDGLFLGCLGAVMVLAVLGVCAVLGGIAMDLFSAWGAP